MLAKNSKSKIHAAVCQKWTITLDEVRNYPKINKVTKRIVSPFDEVFRFVNCLNLGNEVVGYKMFGFIPQYGDSVVAKSILGVIHITETE